MTKIKKLFHVFALTLIAMTLTLFTPTTVHTVEQERDIRFGFPTAFVSMNYSGFSMVEKYNGPVVYYLKYPRQDPTYMIWKNFTVSFVTWFVLVVLIFLLFNRFLKNYRRFEIFLTGSLFLFTIIAFFKFPFEIVILLLSTTLITHLLNEYVAQTKVV